MLGSCCAGTCLVCLGAANAGDRGIFSRPGALDPHRDGLVVSPRTAGCDHRAVRGDGLFADAVTVSASFCRPSTSISSGAVAAGLRRALSKRQFLAAYKEDASRVNDRTRCVSSTNGSEMGRGANRRCGRQAHCLRSKAVILWTVATLRFDLFGSRTDYICLMGVVSNGGGRCKGGETIIGVSMSAMNAPAPSGRRRNITCVARRRRERPRMTLRQRMPRRNCARAFI